MKTGILGVLILSVPCISWSLNNLSGCVFRLANVSTKPLGQVKVRMPSILVFIHSQQFIHSCSGYNLGCSEHLSMNQVERRAPILLSPYHLIICIMFIFTENPLILLQVYEAQL